MTLTIRFARPDDALDLAEFAARTFRDTFGADNRPDDLALHLASAYGAAQQAGELADPDIITLVAAEGGALVAFAQLRRGTTPASVIGAAPIELWRFYLAAEWQGRGLAQQLMSQVVEAARHAGAATLWLGVWERNPRAIAFYRNEVYAEAGTHVFVVGTDPQTDWIMTRPVGGATACDGRDRSIT
jgi:ribosomal protein S18 acetylase RimI-like enzyme